MNALRRVWDHFEEGFIAFLLAAMTLVTFVYVILNNFYTLFYSLGDFFGGNQALLAIGDFILDLAQSMTWSIALTKALFAWLIQQEGRARLVEPAGLRRGVAQFPGERQLREATQIDVFDEQRLEFGAQAGRKARRGLDRQTGKRAGIERDHDALGFPCLRHISCPWDACGAIRFPSACAAPRTRAVAAQPGRRPFPAASR